MTDSESVADGISQVVNNAMLVNHTDNVSDVYCLHMMLLQQLDASLA